MLLSVLLFAAAEALPPPSPETLLSIRASADKLWGECVVEKAGSLARKSDERADVVATAALAACEEWRSAVEQLTEKIAGGGHREQVDRAVEGRVEYWHSKAVLIAVEARS